jgi:hypothetical protein
MKLKYAAAAVTSTAALIAFPASALADDGDGDSDDGGAVATQVQSAPASNYAICHDGILSDDVGQGCTNDGPYGGPPSSSSVSSVSSSSSSSSGSASNYAICHDGSLSDDVGQGCTNDGPYGGSPSSGSASSSSGSSSSGSSSTGSSGGSLSDVPGVPSSFAACVALRESSNGAGSSNVYGILGSGGQGSLAEQKQAFSQLYQQSGTIPWSPYDGCGT